MYKMRRKDRERTEAFARELFKHCEYAILATVDADGSPYCIPISPVLDGEYIYFHCAVSGQKLDNIRREPRVCLTCIGQTKLIPEKLTTAYESTVVFGDAQILENSGDKIDALRILSAKYTPHCLEIAEAGIKTFLPVTAICKIQINRITGKAREEEQQRQEFEELKAD